VSERVARTAVVVRTEWLTPHMVRVTLAGDGLTGFGAGSSPTTTSSCCSTSLTRVRRWDAASGELDIDFVGDASALPAIAAGLERVPPAAPVYAFLEIDGPEEEQKLDTPGDLTAVRLDRSAAGPDLLADTLRGADLPTGGVHAFVHGEAASVRAVRRHLLVERGVARSDLSVSGYWKRGRTEEGWRSDKSEWQRQVAADDQA
jgi:NADPH-dependent ferric siderophore reductase